jgi:hypothetical protein
MISPLGESFGHHIANLAAPQDGFLEAEEYTEKLVAPSPGRSAPLSHGPIVEANLTLYRASDNFPYTLGLDYFEEPYGIENVRIPVGTVLRAEYAYHGEPAIEEGGGVFVATPQSSSGASEAPAVASVRYATTVKVSL